MIEAAGGTAVVHDVTYGIAPDGFLADRPATTLDPGCYRIRISGTGSTEFEVHPDGTITAAEFTMEADAWALD